MMNLTIYEKSALRRKNFKELLNEDPDDVHFYNSLHKRDADKFLVKRQMRGKSFTANN